jgi:hypothetical protein
LVIDGILRIIVDGQQMRLSAQIWIRGFAVAVLALAALSADATPPAPASPPANEAKSADELFLEGQRALGFGQRERAADLLIAAARKDRRCVDLMFDLRFQSWLPAQGCSEIPGITPAPVTGDPAPCVLDRLGLLMKERARQDRPDDAIALRRAGGDYFQRAVAEFPDSPWAGDAALQLLADGDCLTDAGFPDCTMFRIKGYEQWLSTYAKSPRRFGAIKLAAESYLELAGRYEQDRPWHSPLRAELCRGRALELSAMIAAEGPRSEEALWAGPFIAAIKASGKPFSIVPASAVSETRRLKDQEKRQRDFSFLGAGKDIE